MDEELINPVNPVLPALKAQVAPAHIARTTLAKVTVLEYRIFILSNSNHLEIKSFHISKYLITSYSIRAFRILPILLCFF